MAQPTAMIPASTIAWLSQGAQSVPVRSWSQAQNAPPIATPPDRSQVARPKPPSYWLSTIT